MIKIPIKMTRVRIPTSKVTMAAIPQEPFPYGKCFSSKFCIGWISRQNDASLLCPYFNGRVGSLVECSHDEYRFDIEQGVMRVAMERSRGK